MPEVLTRMNSKLIKELEDMAEEAEVSRAEIIRMVLRYGLDAIAEDAEEAGEVDEDDEDETEDEDESEETETCDECKKEIPADSEFCPYCGVEFEDEEESEDEPKEA